jgi:hypothetical protein
MFYFKACRRCRGDLILENDAFGDFLKCMQCGTMIDVEVEVQGRHSFLVATGAQGVSSGEAKTPVAA